MRVLVVGPPTNLSAFSYLSREPDFEIHLLWYEAAEDDPTAADLPDWIKRVHHWVDFATPEELIRRIAPEKIVFMEIIDLRQVALIVTARRLGVTTFYLEHGAAADKATAIARTREVKLTTHKLPHWWRRLRDPGRLLSAKRFYYSVTSGFGSAASQAMYLALPLALATLAPDRALSRFKFPERVPRHNIIFNRAAFPWFNWQNGISQEDALFTGVPFFDVFHAPSTRTGNQIVYIDHPYLESGLLGWTPEHHRDIALNLFRMAEERRLKLYIKLHPRSSKPIWDAYQPPSEYVEIIQQGDFHQLYLESALILGFSSSLLTACLCARKNVVFLSWHPGRQHFGFDFSTTGLCHRSEAVSDLFTKLDDWRATNLCLREQQRHEEFVRDFNYPFDGKATERVLAAIKTL